MNKSKLLILDGHAVAFHSWFTSFPSNVAEGFIYMLDDLVDRHQPTHVAITFDPPPPVFRHLIYPAYKEGRPPAPKRFIEECEGLKGWLRNEKYLLVEIDGYEADDAIGTLSSQASRRGINTVIATCDLDILQLVDDRVTVEVFSQYHPTRFFDVQRTIDRFSGLIPSQIADYKALAGDKSDNLPGVPGIGDVTATALLNKRTSLEDIYRDLSFVKELGLRGPGRIFKILKENRAQAFMMKKMTTIVCDIDLDSDLGDARLPLQVAEVARA